MRAYKVIIHRRVVVNLDDGTAFAGVLLQERGPLLCLGNAQVFSEGQWAPMDGLVWIERPRVLFVQEPQTT